MYESNVKMLSNELGLRSYQQECVQKITDCFMQAIANNFLISAACRYGKTTTALAACKIVTIIKGFKDAVICVVSGLPGSVKSSWRDDAYRLGLIESNSIEALDISNVDFNKTTGIDVTFISTQKFGNNTNKDGEVIEHSYVEEYKTFFNNHLGPKFLITDEAHVASSSDRIIDALSGLKYDYKLELTATPYTEDLYMRYRLDTSMSEANTYFFSQVDMLDLYNNAPVIGYTKSGIEIREGFVNKDGTPWRPVIPVIQVEEIYDKLLAEGWDFAAELDEDKETSFVTAYFKTIFNNEDYEKYRKIFVEKYIIDKSNIVGINFLGFCTNNATANRIANYINAKYGDKIYAVSLADENLTEDEDTFADRVNKIFAKDDNKIHFVITCRKCGTGSSMPLLNATVFLKGCKSFSEWMQFASRSYNPAEGKTYGYTIMFSSVDALQMISQHANSQKHDTSPNPKGPNITDYLKYIKVFLDGKALVDATDVIAQLDSVYNPRQTILFPSLDLMADDILSEIADEVIKASMLSDREESTPSSPSEPKEKSSVGAGKPDGESTKKKEEGKLSPEQLKKRFQEAFVNVIRMFIEDDYTEDDIMLINSAFKKDKRLIEAYLCTMKLWNKLNVEYFNKVLHKVYVYAQKTLVD